MARKFRTGRGTVNTPSPLTPPDISKGIGYEDHFVIPDNDEAWKVVEDGNQRLSQNDLLRNQYDNLEDEEMAEFAENFLSRFILPMVLNPSKTNGDENYTSLLLNQQLVVKLPRYGFIKRGAMFDAFSRFHAEGGSKAVYYKLGKHHDNLDTYFSPPAFHFGEAFDRTPESLIRSSGFLANEAIYNQVKPTLREISGSESTKQRTFTNDQKVYAATLDVNRFMPIFSRFMPVGSESVIHFSNVFTYQAEGHVYYLKDDGKLAKLATDTSGVSVGSIFDVRLTDEKDIHGLNGLDFKELIPSLKLNQEFANRNQLEDVLITFDEEERRLYENKLIKSVGNPSDKFYRSLEGVPEIQRYLLRESIATYEGLNEYSQAIDKFVVRDVFTLHGRTLDNSATLSLLDKGHIWIDELGLIPVNNGQVIVDLVKRTVTLKGDVLNSNANLIKPGRYRIKECKPLNSLEHHLVNPDTNTRLFFDTNDDNPLTPVFKTERIIEGIKLHYIPNARWVTMSSNNTKITLDPMGFFDGLYRRFNKVYTSTSGKPYNDGDSQYGWVLSAQRGDINRLNGSIYTWWWIDQKSKVDVTYFPWKFKSDTNTFLPTLFVNYCFIDPTYWIETQGQPFNVVAGKAGITKTSEFLDAKEFGFWKHVKRLEFVFDSTDMGYDKTNKLALINAKRMMTFTPSAMFNFFSTNGINVINQVGRFTDVERKLFQFQYPIPEGYNLRSNRGHFNLEEVLVSEGLYDPNDPVYQDIYFPEMNFDYNAFRDAEEGKKPADPVLPNRNYNFSKLLTICPNYSAYVWFAMNHLPRFTDWITNPALKQPSVSLNGAAVGSMVNRDALTPQQFLLGGIYRQPNWEVIVKQTNPDFPLQFYCNNAERKQVKINGLHLLDKTAQTRDFGRPLIHGERKLLKQIAYGGRAFEDRLTPEVDIYRTLVLAKNYFNAETLFSSGPFTTFRFIVDGVHDTYRKSTLESVNLLDASTIELIFATMLQFHLTTSRTNTTIGYTLPKGTVRIDTDKEMDFYLSSDDGKAFTTDLTYTSVDYPYSVIHKTVGWTEKAKQRTPVVYFDNNFDNERYRFIGVSWEVNKGSINKSFRQPDSTRPSSLSQRIKNPNVPYLEWTGKEETSYFRYPKAGGRHLPTLTQMQQMMTNHPLFYKYQLTHSRGNNLFNSTDKFEISFIADRKGRIIRPDANFLDVVNEVPSAFYPPFYLVLPDNLNLEVEQPYFVGAAEIRFFPRNRQVTGVIGPTQPVRMKYKDLLKKSEEELTAMRANTWYMGIDFEDGDVVDNIGAEKLLKYFTMTPDAYIDIFYPALEANSYIERDPYVGGKQRVWFFTPNTGYDVTETFDLTGLQPISSVERSADVEVRYIDDIKNSTSGDKRGLEKTIWLSDLGGLATGSGLAMVPNQRQQKVSKLTSKEQIQRFKKFGINLVSGDPTDIPEVTTYWDTYKGKQS